MFAREISSSGDTCGGESYATSVRAFADGQIILCERRGVGNSYECKSHGRSIIRFNEEKRGLNTRKCLPPRAHPSPILSFCMLFFAIFFSLAPFFFLDYFLAVVFLFLSNFWSSFLFRFFRRIFIRVKGSRERERVIIIIIIFFYRSRREVFLYVSHFIGTFRDENKFVLGEATAVTRLAVSALSLGNKSVNAFFNCGSPHAYVRYAHIRMYTCTRIHMCVYRSAIICSSRE